MLVAVACLLVVADGIRGDCVPMSRPGDVGVSSQRLSRINALVQTAIDAEQIPGCVVLLARHGRVFLFEAFGNRQVEPTVEPMTRDTVFDLASITKPVATATSLMCLLEQGRLRLDDTIAMHLPEFENHGKEHITIFQCLTHQAGFVPDTPLDEYDDRSKIWDHLFETKLAYAPGSDFVYSDVGFQILGKLVERVSGESLDCFARRSIFLPLRMWETGYLPADSLRGRCAPTEQRGEAWMRGEVHDPRAFAMHGVAGHAGLFSTAPDLFRYAQMMLQRGQLDGHRVLSPATVRVMTSAYPSGPCWRGLGWDKLSRYSTNRSELYSPLAFGHGGFTGTVLWIDPQLDLIVIVLSNRVHPRGAGNVNRLAGQISNVVVAAIEPPVPELPHVHARIEDQPLRRGSLSAAEDMPPPVDLETGVDVLQREAYRPLTGQRIGLITNHTGRNRDGTTTSQLLHGAPEVNLVCLFSPEHGMTGALDQSRIEDTRDPETDLPVYSLYGAHRAPLASQLAQVDTLVFDIQDIGTRFYTYISTMGSAMRVAAEHGKRFVVLDRPNPIGGQTVDGPVLDQGRESFVGCHTLPVRHGMTVGELAGMFKAEWQLDLRLDVIRLPHWSRGQMWDETQLTWINPSPNMRTPHQALLYPGIGLLETTNLCVGRGTDTPFELVAAPWINGRELANLLTARGQGGVHFVPIEITPAASKYSGESCHGVRFVIDDRRQVQPLQLGFAVACALRDLYGTSWTLADMDRLLCDRRVLELLKSGASADTIWRSYQAELADFEARRAAFLLYE